MFETKPITQSIAVAQELDTLGIFQASPTLEKETMKMVAHDFLEDRNEKIKKQVDSEIDQMKTYMLTHLKSEVASLETVRPDAEVMCCNICLSTA